MLVRSDTARWDELHDNIRNINKQLQAAKAFAEEHGLVIALADDGWLTSYGRGTMELWDHDSMQSLGYDEVWQSSTGCSEQGFRTFAEMDWAKPITKVPGEED